MRSRKFCFIFLISFLFSFLFCLNGFASIDLTITSFNIRWFGLGGEKSGSLKDEYRGKHIRKLLIENYSDSDIFVFQEIVDINKLKQILPEWPNCYSYEHKIPEHQHIVLCTKKLFRFDKERDDNNYAEETVSIGSKRLRPALLGVLKNKDGRSIIRVAGVHLKAKKDSSRRRADQVRALAKRMKSVRPKLPAVLIGDFNTHGKDNKMFSHIFSNVGLKLKEIQNSGHTFANSSNRLILDRIWISKKLEVIKPLSAWEACNSSSVEKNFSNLEFYNLNVSDHCPISVKIRVPGV